MVLNSTSGISFISQLPLAGLGTGGSIQPGGILAAQVGQPGDPLRVCLGLQTTLGSLDDVLQPPTEGEAGEDHHLLPDDPPLPGQAGSETPVPPELHNPGPGSVVLSPLPALQVAVLTLTEEPVAPGQVFSPLRSTDRAVSLQEVVVTQSQLLASTDRGQGHHLDPPPGVRVLSLPHSVVTVTPAGVIQSGAGQEDSTGGMAGHQALSQLETVGAENAWEVRRSINILSARTGLLLELRTNLSTAAEYRKNSG